jgi:acyl-CoA thioester hydrolase
MLVHFLDRKLLEPSIFFVQTMVEVLDDIGAHPACMPESQPPALGLGWLLIMSKSVETYRGVAYPWNCDSMGHMNTQFYAALYDGASFHFLSLLAPSGELKKSGLGWADVRQLIEYKHEITAGGLLVVRTALKRLGNKSIEYRHELRNVETDHLYSTSEQVTVLFDLNKRAAIPLDETIRRRAAALA